MRNMPRKIAQRAIRTYQRTLSLDHGPLSRFRKYPQCKFYPSCSEYACQAIGKFGVLRGGGLAVTRIARCHPWSHGGVDEVPEKLGEL